ncbi:MAG: RnfABCDGE type electron transport complex subunit D [Candidatus Omnitrophica bacterium]|nr:RnfABCDGE type electron transport complex subunit D [Candidatus Omnitrophota bacterium]
MLALLTKKSIKTQLIIFLVIFMSCLALSEREIRTLFPFAITALSAVIAEALLVALRTKKWRITESAIITGLIVGFVLSDRQPWWIYTAVSLLAIGSKHAIRYKGRHIFNPAAFGIVASMLFLDANTQWKGTYQWYILLPAGLYFIYRIRKIELLFAYGITALGIFGAQAVVRDMSVANIFWYLSYFFIFIMLIEPKTTPFTRPGKVLFGIGVAVLIVIFTEADIRIDVELSALLLVNMFVPLLNKWR